MLVRTFIIFQLLFSFPAFAGIEGSAHDFKKLGWRGEDTCILCHTQQNAESAQTSQKWNYASKLKHFALDTSSVDESGNGTPGGTSRLCLSCHDGNIASDILGNAIPESVFGSNTSRNLTSDHPVSVLYNPGGGILHNTNKQIVIGTKNTKRKRGSIDKLLLIEHSVQCSSCHDVHNNYASKDHLLKLKLKNNQICVTCHHSYHESNAELSQFHQISDANLHSLIKDKQMTCFSCHDIHENLVKQQKIPQAVVNESQRLCLRCHKRRGVQ